MSALNHFLKFCGTIADGIAGPSRLAGPEREYLERKEQSTTPPDDQRVTQPMQSVRDDEKRAPPPSGIRLAPLRQSPRRHPVDINQSKRGTAVYFIAAGPPA
jgi:hypothetical protein